MLDRELALLEIGGRLLVQLLELGLRQLEEALVARRERVGRERLHRRLERGPWIGRAQREPRCCGADDEADEDADDHWADER